MTVQKMIPHSHTTSIQYTSMSLSMSRWCAVSSHAQVWWLKHKHQIVTFIYFDKYFFSLFLSLHVCWFGRHKWHRIFLAFYSSLNENARICAYTSLCVRILYFDWRFGDPFIIINTIIKTWTEERLFTVAIVHRHLNTQLTQNSNNKTMEKMNFVKMKWNEAEESNGDEFIYIIRVRKRNKTSLEKLNTHQKKIVSEENFSERLSHKYIVFRFDSFRFVLCASAKLSLSVPLLR